MKLRTRVAGLFLFLPLLARLGFDQLAQAAGYPGTPQVRAENALLSLLSLKLLDKERQSHIEDFNFDQAVGLFAGLNVLPKKSFASDYSYRTERENQLQLQSGWLKKLAPILMDQPQAFALDFHPIPFRGQESDLENHFLPMRGTAKPSLQTFFALEQKSRVLCYANANLTRVQQGEEVLKFVEFWKGITGQDPQWLYFDSKLTSYEELSRLNQRGVRFATIRRRGASLVRRFLQLPSHQWQSAVIAIPKRRHQKIRYVDEQIPLRGYEGAIRQLAVQDLGRVSPTFFLTNDLEVTARQLVMNYARRNGVEDNLGTNVNFFHLDCLSSDVRLNVDLDTTLTVLANGCYRWLGHCLHGYQQTKPKQLYRKFVETGGRVEVEADKQITVYFDRRAHNPVLREAALDRDSPPIPWLANHHVKFHFG